MPDALKQKIDNLLTTAGKFQILTAGDAAPGKSKEDRKEWTSFGPGFRLKGHLEGSRRHVLKSDSANVCAISWLAFSQNSFTSSAGPLSNLCDALSDLGRHSEALPFHPRNRDYSEALPLIEEGSTIGWSPLIGHRAFHIRAVHSKSDVL
ncbi:uncharacterized protein EI90DRAFT_3115236 [Cantharellus anzutake]|uniref:uncharacterized protein n=1 Tax=Cantharellus anzutake TaxID=1750568 RepID=UPI0019046818|nr:uncharacterized protein EI90DRAFT_3115236 [Cantharellus anzutake]KAF8342669.1 hypothetical protein EI90DRAFT_3115236 [Cantharellus anzutake]